MLLKVYSWPLKMLTSSPIFFVKISMFLTISSAFPSKNLPMPAENNVSPVNAHYSVSKTLTFFPSIVSMLSYLTSSRFSEPFLGKK